MRMLVTGGAGFIGSTLVKLAISKGLKVKNVDSLTYSGSLANVACVEKHPNYTFENINVCNQKAINAIFKKYRPDYVAHLAAETHVDRSISSSAVFINTNVTGTHVMLQAALDYWQSQGKPERFRFLQVSTDEVFGSLEINSKSRFGEDCAYNPNNPYSASKAGADHLARAWQKTYNLPIVITRSSNNYGPFQHPEKLIPRMILRAMAGKSLPVYGNGSHTREWLNVSEHAEALFLALIKGKVGRSYNIGSGHMCSNLDLLNKICAIMDAIQPMPNGRHDDKVCFVKDRPGHDEKYAIDSTRARSELGWKSNLTFELGLKNTVSWYIENARAWKPSLDYLESLG